MTIKFNTIAGWIEERQSANKRSGSVVISLFADFVVPHGGAVALGSLVEAGGLTGISEQTIRSSVNRLAADGWLTTEPIGRRSICRLSETAQRRFNTAIPRIYQSANELWDGQWHILVANNWKIDNENYTQYVRSCNRSLPLKKSCQANDLYDRIGVLRMTRQSRQDAPEPA